MRTALACAACLAPIALAAPAQGAPSRARQHSSCATLKGHVKRKGEVRIAEQGNEAKAFAHVCLAPRGRVWTAGTAFSSPPGSGYAIDVAAQAGDWVALEFFNGLGIAGESIDKLVNAASGKSFRYWSASIGPGVAGEEVPHVERTLLNASGQLAFSVLVEEAGKPKRTEVFGVEASGRRKLLDSGMPSVVSATSLALSGSTVRWLDAGATRTATL
jgi:hypothetical protein